MFQQSRIEHVCGGEFEQHDSGCNDGREGSSMIRIGPKSYRRVLKHMDINENWDNRKHTEPQSRGHAR